jgi:hypothetical protein
MILLMRHGEKLNKELSSQGHIRADYLSTYFRNFRPDGVNLPTHLISMKPKRHSSRRCVDTMIPMARDFETELIVKFTREQVSELVKYVKKLPIDAVPLICWEHHFLVHIARELGFSVLNWNDQPFSNERDTKAFNILWKVDGDVFESFDTFDIDHGHIVHYFNPLRQRYIKKT